MQLIILDRDGVINEDSTEFIKSPREWKAIPGSLAAIARLCQNGYRVVVVTNQSGLARKKLDVVDLIEIHRKLLDHLAQYGGTIDAFFFCPHEPAKKCECRKPNTGLFREIAERLRISLEGVPVVGDKQSDVDAAIEIGARPILVRTGYGKETIAGKKVPDSVPVFDNLAAVADYLIPAEK